MWPWGGWHDTTGQICQPRPPSAEHKAGQTCNPGRSKPLLKQEWNKKGWGKPQRGHGKVNKVLEAEFSLNWEFKTDLMQRCKNVIVQNKCCLNSIFWPLQIPLVEWFSLAFSSSSWVKKILTMGNSCKGIIKNNGSIKSKLQQWIAEV